MSINSVFNMVPKNPRTCTPSGNILPSCVGVYANSAGNVTATNMLDEVITIKLAANQAWVGRLKKITAWSGSAGDLLYYQEG